MGTTEEDRSNRSERPPLGSGGEVVAAKLAALMDHTSSGVAIYEATDNGEDFVFADFNRAAEEIEKIRKAELLGRSVQEVFPGVRQFGLFDVFQRVWRTGEPEHHPVSIYEDERIAGWRQNYVCRLPNGQIMAVYDDVTQSKHSELATRMSEQCFRAIANYTYGWEVWIGPNGRILWTNPAATRITGYSVKELVTLPDYPGSLVHEQDRDRVRRAFRSAVGGSTGNDLQFRILRKEGGTVWVEMSWLPIHDDKGSPLGHRQSIRDITIRKRAEGALERAEHEKEMILDSLAEHVIHQDRDRKILWANRAACESVGLARAEITGRYCYDLWADRCEPQEDCPVVRAIQTGGHAEAERRTSDGRIWLIRATPVRDEEGRVVGAVEIALDATGH